MNKPKQSKPQPMAYSLASFCDAYDVPRSRAYEEIAAGRLQTFKIGRRRMVSAAAAAAWLSVLERGEAAA
ncbi:MAG: hypothetical protein KDI51_13940 [Xanthomonadales bacterium]|nr:hypothetical protein [Xanthomonadales bacterium]